MSSNRLRLNPSKTQYIWLGTRQQLAKLDLAAMATRFPHITFSLTVRDLGLTVDQQLTFAPHINHLCRDCYYQLRQLRVISRTLTSTASSLLLLLLSTLLSHLGLTTAPHSTLVSLLCVWAVLSGLSALPRAS